MDPIITDYSDRQIEDVYLQLYTSEQSRKDQTASSGASGSTEARQTGQSE